MSAHTPQHLPKNVRRHGLGFRAVVTVDKKRTYGPVVGTPEAAAIWARRMRTSSGMLSITLEDACADVFQALERVGRSPGTLVWYRQQFRMIKKHWAPSTPMHRISMESIHAFIAARRSSVSQATINMQLIALQRLFAIAMKNKRVLDNPMEKFEFATPVTPRRDVLEAEEVATLIERARVVCSARVAALVAVLFYTGLRRSEVGRLRVDDVNLKLMEVYVRGKVRPRTIPLAQEAVPYLLPLVKGKPDHHLVFTSPKAVSTLMERLQTRLADTRIHCHTLRHSFATALARSGVTPYVLRELMGHRDLATTMIYFHAHGDEQRRAISTLRLPSQQGTSGSPSPADPRPESQAPSA